MLNHIDKTFIKNYNLILAETLDKLRKNIINYTMKEEIKNFFLYLLNNKNPLFKNYMQFLGMDKIIKTSIGILNELIGNEVLNKNILSYIAALNAYFAYEVISDDLGIGTMYPTLKNKSQELCKEIIIKFNNAMQEKLMGNKNSSSILLKPYASLINSIPSYNHHYFAEQYIKLHPHAHTSIHELEYSLGIYLSLNIDACQNFINLLKDHPIYILLKKSVTERYTALNQLFKVDHFTSPKTLAEHGAKTILITPTLAYLIGVVDIFYPNPKLNKIIQQNLLAKPLEISSCMIRLFNDAGSKLIMASNDEQELVFNKIRQIYQKQISIFRDTSILDFLEEIYKTQCELNIQSYLKRIKKDIIHGEFNICYDNVRYLVVSEESLNMFFENIRYYSNLYQIDKATLTNHLQDIDKQLGSTKISTIILNSIKFHQKHYH